jgi:hypothetical protein
MAAICNHKENKEIGSIARLQCQITQSQRVESLVLRLDESRLKVDKLGGAFVVGFVIPPAEDEGIRRVALPVVT